MTDIIHGYNPTVNDIIPVRVDAGGFLEVVGTTGETIQIYSTVQGAAGGGPGYAAGDILVLRQVGTNAPEWVNTNGNAVIAAPTNIEPVGGASSAVQVTNLPATVATNAGAVDANTVRVALTAEDKAILGTSPVLQPVTYDIVDGATGNSGIRFGNFIYASALNALTDTSPITPGAATGNAANIQLTSGTQTASGSSLQAYQIDGTGTVLYGEVDNAAGTITPLGGGAAVAIGTGAGEAQLVPNLDTEVDRRYTATAPDRAPDYVAGNELLRLIERTGGGSYAIAWLNADTGARFTTAPVSPTPEVSGGAGVDFDAVRYRLNDGTYGLGWYDQSTQVLYADIDRAAVIPIGANATDAVLASIHEQDDSAPVATQFNLDTTDAISATFSPPTGAYFESITAEIRVSSYASVGNNPILFLLETTTFNPALASDFSLIAEGTQGSAVADITAQIAFSDDALKSISSVRVRRVDGADTSATALVRLSYTLR
ncbi:MAG: hypothetical protein AAGA46_00510 [Cyanobacteria bacterium P01_F01_bin.13]